MSDSLLQALADVRRIKRHVLESQQFYGYSGAARVIGGLLSLLTAYLLSSSALVPRTVQAHLLSWGLLCAAAAAVNYGAVALWYSRLDPRDAERARLRPIFDPIPALVGGGVISAACMAKGYYDVLFGVWMISFGVAHLAARVSLDEEISYLGWFYLAAGALQLLLLPGSFLDPWPMGLVFFAGEITGGLIFARMRRRSVHDEPI